MSYAKLFVAAYNLADHFLVQKKLLPQNQVSNIFCILFFVIFFLCCVVDELIQTFP